jgi:succinate dehydrogenase/fumarate reductase-like Fe-S protein
VHPALLLLDLVPELWWNQDRYLGPSIPLQFSRWLAESRDQRTGERLDQLEDPFRLYRGHTIMKLHQRLPERAQPGARDRQYHANDGRARLNANNGDRR